MAWVSWVLEYCFGLVITTEHVDVVYLAMCTPQCLPVLNCCSPISVCDTAPKYIFHCNVLKSSEFVGTYPPFVQSAQKEKPLMTILKQLICGVNPFKLSQDLKSKEHKTPDLSFYYFYYSDEMNC